MEKIKQIKIQNLGPIDEFEQDLNCKSFWVIASNGEGKTTIVDSLCRIMTTSMPHDVIKEGADAGMCQLVMDDGTIIRWSQERGKKAKVVIHFADGSKETPTQTVLAKLFGDTFDINKFLVAGDGEKVKIISKLFNQDLDEINGKIKAAETERTDANRDLKKAEANKKPVEAKWLKESELDATAIVKEKEGLQNIKNKIDEINKEITALETDNENRKNGIEVNEAAITKIEPVVQEVQSELDKIALVLGFEPKGGQLEYFESEYCVYRDKANELMKSGHSYVDKLKEKIKEFGTVNQNNSDAIVSNEAKIENLKKELEEYADTDFAKIDTLNSQLENLTTHNNSVKTAKDNQATVDEFLKLQGIAEKAEEKVKKLRDEKQEIIKANPVPVEGLETSEDGKDLIYKGVAFSSLAKSMQTIIAAKLCLSLQKIPVIGIDASPLDKQNTMEFVKWCDENGVQVGVEKPCWEDERMELRVELID